ncbi:MAG: HNH endonuclease [Gammaproteobacteria bacterium]|nr:HNH endonuclease [Gammaproteobacteria bacterium]
MRFDPQLLGSRISGQIGLHFKVSSGVDAESQDWCLLQPKDLPSDFSEDHAFGIRITLGWRRLHVSFEPGQFAGRLLSDMAKADKAGRAVFRSILQECVQLGADINFEVNDVAHALDDDGVWEQNWNRVSLHLNKGQLDLGIEEGGPDIEIVSQWTERFASAIMSILPIEREMWTSQEDLSGHPEGAVSTLQVNRYERDQRNRDAAILIHGAVCKVCGLDFESRYGKVAAGFIEVHHITPVSQLGSDYHVDPEKDLVPLCPNCHAVAHRRDPPFSIDEIKQMLRSDKQSL